MGNDVPSDPTSPLPPPPDGMSGAGGTGTPGGPGGAGGLDVMTCEQAVRQIERLIEDGELKEIERALLFTHIRVCPACKTELQKHRHLELRLKETFAPIDTRPDFNQRLLAALPDMDYKPKIEVMPSSDSVGRRTSRVDRISSRMAAQMPRLRWFYRWRTAIGVAACVLLGLLGLAVRLGIGFPPRDADKPPIVMELSGKAHIKHHDKQVSPLASERTLAPADVLSADVSGTDFECWLNFGDAHLAHITLSSGAELTADNRHLYTLKSGSAHFDVEKNRPRGPDELFEVKIADTGSVRVRGTSFDIKNADSGAPVVAVQEGHVEVQCGSSMSELTAGEQIALGANGFSSPVVAIAAPKPPVSTSVPPLPPIAVQPTPPAAVNNTTTLLPAPFDWETRVGTLSIEGKTLAEGIDTLAAKLGNPPAITALAQLARNRLVSQENRLTFSINRTMPVRSVLAWMARDVGARFEVDGDGRGALRIAGPEELPGPPQNGAIPPEIREALEKRLHSNMRFTANGSDVIAAHKRSVSAALAELAWQCGVTIVAEHVDTTVLVTLPAANEVRSGARQLDEILANAHLCAAWYDNALYVAPAARLEVLTTVDRQSKLISDLVGLPEQPVWTQNLFWLLNQHAAMPAQLPRLLPGLPLNGTVPGYWDVDKALAGRAAFANLSVVSTKDGLGPWLQFRAGIFGELHLNVLLGEIERGSPKVHGASGLTNVLPSAVIRDTSHLIELAKPFMPVESRVKNLPFNHQALAVRNLPLGRTLEWGAWLNGCGIASGTNGLVIDEATACYGAPAPQILTLVPAVDHGVDTAQLPDVFAKLLPRLYPTFFANVEFKPLAGRLAFVGDKRQLQLAQELFHVFEEELNAAPAAGPGDAREFDVAAWLPAWRRSLEQNLAEPFKGDGSGTVNGTFAGLLRQSGIGTQLRHTVIVDLQAMQQNHNAEIKALDVSQLSIGQYLDALARAADMKVVLEGEVILLKPSR